jgi:tol-pal system beta propeller repeat protein TolB
VFFCATVSTRALATSSAHRTDAGEKTGHIAFDDDAHDVWSVNADGSDPRRLTSAAAPEFDPSWSPDGSAVTYRSEVDGNAEIYVMKADGSAKRNLTHNLAEDYSPTWSPDGKHIAFASSRTGVFNDIYVMDADGSHVRRLTRQRSADEYPTWSPNGRRIAFASDRNGRWEIYVISVNGTHERRLTRTGGKAPAWSPRGRRIAYQGPSGSRARRHGMNALWLIRTDGRRGRRIARNAYSPAWPPDGNGILVSREGSGLTLLSLAGKVRRHIVPGPAIDADWARR